MSGIVVRELEKSFEDRKRGLIRALDRVTFECKPGRIFGLLGPNGAGKTTALRVLSTMLRPTGGEALVNGFNVATQASAVRASIGFLSGATGLYERSTAKEILYFFGELYGLSGSPLKQRVDELATLFRMEDFLDQACGRLSSGQRQKVNISRSVVHDPPIIILDEPTANLDILVGREVLLFVESERLKGKTVLLSTHVMSEVDRLCDDLAIIHNGRVLKSGTKSAIVAEADGISVESVFFKVIGEPNAQQSKEPIL
jgi:sodium transport system ATP-binding protein